jgi:hypothetical protein
MVAANEYRGIVYSIANNDDGVWRWLEMRTVAPRPTYPTRDAAVQAAKAAIDALLDGRSAKIIAPDMAGKQTGDPGPQ